MRFINEDEAELIIEEQLPERGWNLTDFQLTRKRWREHLDGDEADRVFLHEGKIVAILEAKDILAHEIVDYLKNKMNE